MNYRTEPETRFAVVEMYINENDNRVSIIAEKRGVSYFTANRILNEYFRDGCITVESKMNLKNQENEDA